MRCERGSLLVVDTSEGVFYAAVPSFGDWGCDQALEQWRGVTPPDARVGLRYVEPPEGPALTLINDRGGSQVLRVSGAWRKAPAAS
jgi:hypothetical protein